MKPETPRGVSVSQPVGSLAFAAGCQGLQKSPKSRGSASDPPNQGPIQRPPKEFQPPAVKKAPGWTSQGSIDLMQLDGGLVRGRTEVGKPGGCFLGGCCSDPHPQALPSTYEHFVSMCVPCGVIARPSFLQPSPWEVAPHDS